MIFKQFYLACLAHASYLIGDEETGTAVAVDPQRDVDQYIAFAAEHALTIKHVILTHLHADFVAGHLELRDRVGATIYLGAAAKAAYPFTPLHDGDVLEFGRVRLKALETPGHTPESISIVIYDRNTSDTRPYGVLTGDTLFVGDVGRPDLLERAANQQGTMEGMARKLFQSLKATTDLPDYLQLWPGHGAGSSCGRELGALPSTTLGFERVANWAFQFHDENSFVEEVLSGQPEPPGYFARMKTVNRSGPPPLPSLAPIREVGAHQIQDAFHTGVTVVDVRSSASFAAGHIPGTMSIPMGTSLATWAGTFVPESRDIVLITDDDDRLSRARHTLALIGLDRVVAWAGQRALDEWQSEIGELERVEQVSVDAIANGDERTVIDVRGNAEWEEGHLPNARHYFLGDLVRQARDLPHDTPIAVHCHGGTRSSVAASLLQAQGFTNVANMSGGYRAWTEANKPVERDEAHADVPK